MRIVVEHLHPDLGERQVRAAFELYGAVREIEIVPDQRHPRGRNLAFITMPDDSEARIAIQCMRGCLWASSRPIWCKAVS